MSDVSSNLNMFGSHSVLGSAAAPAFRKQDTKVAPGVLSNNLKTSNVMKFLNAEHKRKVQEMERIERKR